MIKKGYRLYATKVYDSTFEKQAKSPAQFMRMCIAQENAGGYYFARKFNYMYKPDFVYDEERGVWLNMSDGSVYGKTLPWRKK